MTASERAAIEAIEAIEKSGGGYFAGPMPEALVRKAEAILSVSFPPGYRFFLLKLGCGDINGSEFFGLVGEPVDRGPVPNVVWYTKELRQSALGSTFLPVFEPGDGCIYVIDTNDPEEHLLVFTPFSDDIEPLGLSFGEFLREAVMGPAGSEP